MNEKENFGSNNFEKVINKEGGGEWNKKQGVGGGGDLKKMKKLISGGTSIRTLRA